MDQKQIAKQMVEFNKTAFDNTFYAMTALQDQTEKIVFQFLEKAQWFPEDGKKVINDWVKAYKKGREDFKASADGSYKKVSDFFAKAEKLEVPKAVKK
jgi:hypothetical protein